MSGEAKRKAVLILSGGVDSTTLLYELIDQGYDVYPITFFYGQRHQKEVECAKRIVTELGIREKWIAYPITSLGKMGASALTDPKIAVPDGHYEDANMKATVVPNRNMVLLSMAIAHCIAVDVDTVFYGAHSGDHAIYPDCRFSFVDAMKDVAAVCHYTPINLEAPYLELSKGDIVERGLVLGVPYEKTWTCYKGLAMGCGTCGSCVERKEAFEINGEKDPLEYCPS